MKKCIILLIYIVFTTTYYSQIQYFSVKLVFVQDFSIEFQQGEVWGDVSEEDVKNIIFERVRADFQSKGIVVQMGSNATGHITCYIGKRRNEGYSGSGYAVTGIGSYMKANPYAEVYPDYYAEKSEFQGKFKATASRIGNCLAGITAHEIGHIMNLHHAYLFTDFDPTCPSALNAHFLPIDPRNLDGCNFNGESPSYIMNPSTEYITYEERATLNLYFNSYSSSIIYFAKLGGTNMSKSITWAVDGATFLQQKNVQMANNLTFIIAYGAYNLNGKYLFAGSVENHGQLSGDIITLTNGSNTKGYFTYLKDATELSESGDLITVNNSCTLSANVLVESGVTLLVKAGVTVNLNGYKLLSTGGSIIVESGGNINSLVQLKNNSNVLLGYYPTIQSAIDDAVSGQKVEIGSGTFTGNLSLVNKNSVELKGTGNTTINGNITITNSSYSSVSDLSMANGKTITINGGNWSKLSNITSTIGSGAINVYDGTATEISNSSYISDEVQAPAWSFYNTNSGGLMSDVIEGYMFGIYANSGSYISLNAPLFCNNMLDLYANGSTTSIYAREYVLSYEGATLGNVTLADGNEPCGSGGIFKSSITQNELAVNDNLREANSAFRALLMDENISKSFTLTEKSKNKIKAVITKYINALLINLSQDEINEALRKLSACYKLLDEVAVFADYVSSLISNKSISKEMKRFLIPSIVGKGNYNEAINLINEILTYKDISLDLEYELLYEKGTIQKYYLNEKELSEEVFLNLYKKAGDHILAQYAKAQLENQYSLNDGNKPINDDTSEIDANYEISSYPNPFNPTTTIEYQIPKDGFVNLVVYNTLGQVVAELVNEHQTSGKYSVKFNANNLPSGVYFYKIVADSYGESGSFNKVSKMLLLR